MCIAFIVEVFIFVSCAVLTMQKNVLNSQDTLKLFALDDFNVV